MRACQIARLVQNVGFGVPKVDFWRELQIYFSCGNFDTQNVPSKFRYKARVCRLEFSGLRSFEYFATLYKEL